MRQSAKKLATITIKKVVFCVSVLVLSINRKFIDCLTYLKGRQDRSTSDDNVSQIYPSQRDMLEQKFFLPPLSF